MSAITSNPLVRSITHDKLVNSSLLNRLGMQVFRTIAAKALYKVRPAKVDTSVRQQVTELQREGMIVIPNFLPEEVFEGVQNECISALDKETIPNEIHDHGATKVKIARLNKVADEQFPNTLRFYADPLIKHVFEAVEKRKFTDTASLWGAEHVTQGPADEEDRESSLHSDIFYNTHKAWLYLTDVEEKDGPLVFVRRSHKTSLNQLGHIYRHSVSPAQKSRRVQQAELDQMGLKEEIMVSPKNTLVIANTCGYHRRLKGQPGGQRYALHVSMRSQPFMVWKNK